MSRLERMVQENVHKGRGLVVRFSERVLPDVELDVVEDASIDKAILRERSGEFLDAASIYSTLLTESEDGNEKLNALVGLSQNLINLGRLRQAKEVLINTPYQITEGLLPNDNDYLQARVLEKLAWISDYEGNFNRELELLESSQSSLENIPESERGQRERELMSTITHFFGRAHAGLALTGKDREVNLDTAKEYFRADLMLNRTNEGQGYNHAWIGRCELALGNIEEAENSFYRANGFFGQAVEEGEANEGVLAHYHMLIGGLNIQKGNFSEAREQFSDALEIRSKGNFPKGQADALAGVAYSYWSERKYGFAASYFIKAIKTYPRFLLRPAM